MTFLRLHAAYRKSKLLSTSMRTVSLTFLHLIKVQARAKKSRLLLRAACREEEIERMMKDAELNAEEDRKRRELVEAKNNADQLVYSVDKTIKDLGDKVDAGEIEKANEAKEKVTTALESDESRRNQQLQLKR